MDKKEALLREALLRQETLNKWGNILANGKLVAVRLMEIVFELKENHGITKENIEAEINKLK